MPVIAPLETGAHLTHAILSHVFVCQIPGGTPVSCREHRQLKGEFHSWLR